MNILKTPYLEQEISQLNGNSFEDPFLSRQMSSPFLTDIVFDEEATQDVLEEDYKIFDNDYISEEDEFEENWDDDFEDEFVEFGEDHYEEETAYDDFKDMYDESELEEEIEFEEQECSCNEDELDKAYFDDIEYDDFQEEIEDEGQFNEFEYDDFDYEEELGDEGNDNEFNDYEEVEEEIEDGFYNYEDAELEEAFFSSLRKHFNLWTQKKKTSNPTPLLPRKSSSRNSLKLPIVSTLLPDSSNYIKTRNSPEKYYGIPETIAALQWIGKEWVKLHSNVQFIIRDISQMGGGWIKGHGSHRMGIDVDVRLRIEGKLISSRRQNYRSHRKYVRDLITIVTKNPYLSIVVIGFQDRVLNNEFGKLVRPWKNHSRHLHLRFCMPSNRISKVDFNKVYPKGSKGSFKTCGEIDVKYTDTVLSSGSTSTPASTTKPQTINIQGAIKYNRQKKHSLGWAKHVKLINGLLRLPLQNPTDAQFVKAVASWQRRKGFNEEDIDGKIGSNTWIKIKRILGISNENSTNASEPSTNGNKKYPDGFKPIKRTRNERRVITGLSRYSSQRLDEKLLDMRKRMVINITDNELDIFQRIANVETSGKVQGINTWDSAVVSMGFMQLTLQHGKIQRWIKRAPSVFKKFGIELEENKNYTWKRRNKKTKNLIINKQHGIVGAEKNELRWSPWVERFYKAGLNENIIAAEVELAKDYLRTHLNRVKTYLDKNKSLYKTKFVQYYNESPYVRGIFQASYNNLPVAAKRGALYAIKQAERENYPSTNRFIEIYKRNLQKGYNSLNDPEGATRLIRVTKNGAIF